MKRAEKLWKALSDLPDELILEADPTRVRRGALRLRRLRILASSVAAVLVLAVVLSFLPGILGGAGSDDPLPGTDGPGIVTEIPHDPPALEEPDSSDVETHVILGSDQISRMFYSVPQTSWNGAAYSKGYGGMDVDEKVFRRLYEQGILDPSTPAYEGDMYHESYPRIPYDTVIETVLDVWGPFYAESQHNFEGDHKLQGLRDYRSMLLYEESTHSFVYYNLPLPRYPDSNGDHFYGRLISVEQEGEEILAYVRYACYDTEGGVFSIYGEKGGYYPSIEEHRSVLLRGTDSSDYLKNENSIYSRLMAGVFDEYLPIYRVVFRPDGEGSYWWSYSLEVQEGQAIPKELTSGALPESSESKGMLLPLEGEKDSPVTESDLSLSYWKEDWLYLTVDGLLCRYHTVAGQDEVLTPAECIAFFNQTEGDREIYWEVYSAKEYANYFGIILVNVTESKTLYLYNYST